MASDGAATPKSIAQGAGRVPAKGRTPAHLGGRDGRGSLPDALRGADRTAISSGTGRFRIFFFESKRDLQRHEVLPRAQFGVDEHGDSGRRVGDAPGVGQVEDRHELGASRPAEMIGHQDERREHPSRSPHGPLQASRQPPSVGIVLDDVLPTVAPHLDLVDGGGILEPQPSGHEFIEPSARGQLK